MGKNLLLISNLNIMEQLNYLSCFSEQRNRALRIDLIKANIPVTLSDIVYIDEQGFHAHLNNKEYHAETTSLLIQKIKQ